MMAAYPLSIPLAGFGRWLLRWSLTRYSLVDQALVSALGFAAGIAVARQVGIADFGRFAVLMILVNLAQGVQNAVIVAPMMSLAGTRRGRSSAFFASAVAASAAFSALLACGAMAFFAAFEFLEGEPATLGLVAAMGALAAAQTLLFTIRRILFALGRGGAGLAVDAWRGAGLTVAFLAIWIFKLEADLEVVIWILAATTVLPALVAAKPVAFSPRRGRRILAIFKRCWPMGRWFLPTAIATFGQEQVVWLSAGLMLGDGSIGGLRAAQYLAGLAYPALAALENVVPTEASRAYNQGGRSRLNAYVAKTTLMFSPLAVAFPLIAAGFAPFWLRLFFGSPFAEFAGSLRVFALVVLFVFLRDMLSYWFRAVDRTDVPLQAFVAGAATTLLTMVPLIHAFGAFGAAVAIAAGHGASMAYLLAFAVRRKGGFA